MLTTAAATVLALAHVVPIRYTRCPETHNEVEKRRRAYLTQCYIELQNVVPIISDCKASNVTVLKHATDYILVRLVLCAAGRPLHLHLHLHLFRARACA